MSAKTGDLSFETLSENIYAGDTKITKIYAGDTLVYPTRDSGRYTYRFWYQFPESFPTVHGSALTNRGGHYFVFDKNDVPIYRAAVRATPGSPSYFLLFFTNVNFGIFNTNPIAAIGYLALNDDVIYDYYNGGNHSFIYYEMVPRIHSSGKIYYEYQLAEGHQGKGIHMNLYTADRKYMTDVYPGWSVGGLFGDTPVKPFGLVEDAISYVVGDID